MPPSAIMPTRDQADGTARTTAAVTTAIVARSRSGVRVRIMPSTAWATTATAAIFRPCSQPLPPALPSASTP